ncbi:hypothetical protein HDIA_2283 [Hartmannibacter diazotrophicus]|uniref:Uncharacterized protein n=1 Tax=Hartmannibacter diazotrophicus TaxID=1482074 RepID=A0A2C9D676_9HYPH|nr:hypothetical protein [Hartmannibacter diazotrophicus]SON55824.1 hypothetical protein HDIA_2283 [Hartmannibacter diazotrophicus]
MPIDKSLDPTLSRKRSQEMLAVESGPARDWYTLTNAMIGAKELPTYGRALEIILDDAVNRPVTFVVVPIDETSDAATRSIPVYTSGPLPRSVRRIVSINGAAVVPAGVQVDVITV